MIPIEKPRAGAQQLFAGMPETIFDHMKPMNPPDPNAETAPSSATGTIFDYYVPIGDKKEDPNENCYWDKKVIKEKQELEQSVARMKAKSREEAAAWNAVAAEEKAAVAAARRGSDPGEGLGYYALFK